MTNPWPLPPNYLPTKQPGDLVQASFPVCPNASVPVTSSLSAAPSGVGELALLALTVVRNVATVSVSGGVAGRVYTLSAVTTDASGDEFQVLAFLTISDTLETDPPPVPPDAGFGTAILWDTEVGQFTPRAVTGSCTLTAGGTGQVLVTSVVNGGIVYNPLTAVDESVDFAESVWVDITGAQAVVGSGGTSVEVRPGEQFPLTPSTVGVSWAASTTGHKISAVVW